MSRSARRWSRERGRERSNDPERLTYTKGDAAAALRTLSNIIRMLPPAVRAELAKNMQSEGALTGALGVAWPFYTVARDIESGDFDPFPAPPADPIRILKDVQ